MKYKDFVTSFVREWHFVRSETYEILNSLDDKKLQFRPTGKTWQPLFWEFGCIWRTQLVYTKALETGIMDFSYFHSDTLPNKADFKTKNTLSKQLQETDKKWIESIRSRRDDEEFKVKWPGFNKSVPNHIAALISHERIHHGQFISYFTLAQFELPKRFKTYWAL